MLGSTLPPDCLFSSTIPSRTVTPQPNQNAARLSFVPLRSLRQTFTVVHALNPPRALRRDFPEFLRQFTQHPARASCKSFDFNAHTQTLSGMGLARGL